QEKAGRASPGARRVRRRQAVVARGRQCSRRGPGGSAHDTPEMGPRGRAGRTVGLRPAAAAGHTAGRPAEHRPAHRTRRMAGPTDPENRLLSHAVTRRLDAEQIRDALLSVTGKLDLTPGGPSVATAAPRRTVYTKVKRNTRDPLLELFDAPESFTSTSQRNVTT